MSRKECKKHPNQNLSTDAFLSAVFFYGITLATLYAIQIGVIGFELMGKGNMTLSEEIKFILGIRDFSAKGIVTAFLLSHLPYLAYYVVGRTSR